jgi:hypothetical protein
MTGAGRSRGRGRDRRPWEDSASARREVLVALITSVLVAGIMTAVGLAIGGALR